MEQRTQTPGWCLEFSASIVRNCVEIPKAGKEWDTGQEGK